jgi:CelD/BcsL family acetyltransferase involved in cellulose biosynthesis
MQANERTENGCGILMINRENSVAIMSSPATMHTSVVSEEAGFDALAEEWDGLLEESEQRVYFLRWGWNRAWWRAFKPAGSRLFIITCRDEEGRLAGLAPFYVAQRRTAGIPHVREVMFLGTGIYAQTSEYLDLIARRGDEKEVAESVVRYLSGSREWDRLWMNEIPAASTIFPYLHKALGDETQVNFCNCSYYIDTTSGWDAFSKQVSKTIRKNAFRLTRRLFESHDCRFQRIERVEELEPAMDALVRLHQARWTSKGEPGSFSIAGPEQLLREAAQLALADGRLRLWMLEIDGRVAAARLAFLDNGIVHDFQGGFDPVYAKHSLGSIMVGLCIKDCIEDREVREYDFMGGTPGYKELWSKSRRQSLSLSWLRSGIRSLAYDKIERGKLVVRSVFRKTLPLSVRRRGRRFLNRTFNRMAIASFPLLAQSEFVFGSLSELPV